MRSHDPEVLPAGLPEPLDDGACAHLAGLASPSLALTGTSGGQHDLAAQSRNGWIVVFVYPRTGGTAGRRADVERARGRAGLHAPAPGLLRRREGVRRPRSDRHGLSLQDTGYQREAVHRLGLEYELLSDADRRLTRALRLPTFEVAGQTLLRRHTMFLYGGRIQRVRYPVFPPDQDAGQALAWLRSPARDGGTPLHWRPTVRRGRHSGLQGPVDVAHAYDPPDGMR